MEKQIFVLGTFTPNERGGQALAEGIHRSPNLKTYAQSIASRAAAAIGCNSVADLPTGLMGQRVEDAGKEKIRVYYDPELIKQTYPASS